MIRTLSRLSAIALLLVGAAACTSPLLGTAEAPVMVARTTAVTAPPTADDAGSTYRLSVGDTIEIKLFHNPELNELQVIRPDGRISMQFIGELRVAGLSTAEVESVLRERYTNILRAPQATVFVRKYVPQRVYVAGQVVTPGVVPVEGPTTLMQAVFHAGGFKFNAEKRNVLVFRHNGTPQAEVLVVNLDQQLVPTAALCEPMPQCARDPATGILRLGDIVMQPNDIVYVPQSAIGQLAQFMDENIGRIIPLFRNMGVNLYYQINRDLKTTTTIVGP